MLNVCDDADDDDFVAVVVDAVAVVVVNFDYDCVVFGGVVWKKWK